MTVGTCQVFVMLVMNMNCNYRLVKEGHEEQVDELIL
jgi:hypothetical protein